MKKTIEEKAKRYDEALEMARTYYSTTDSVADTELIELIFPELQESEDEKIRKALVYHFQGDGCICNRVDNIPYKDILAWLEKQSEQNTIEPQKKYAKEEENIINDIEQCIEQCGDSFMPSNGTSSANMLAWLEKQK